MNYPTFIHNDNVKCFHVALQGTHKLVMMGCINFEDHALIKKRHAYEKMNVTGEMFKDEKKWGNCRKQFAFIIGIHSTMSVESAIEKLQ